MMLYGNVQKFKYFESRISNFINECKLKSNKFTKCYFLENNLNERGIEFLKEYKYHEVYNNITNRLDTKEFFNRGYKEVKIFKTITIDNEQALINAINKFFPNTSRISCWFHLKNNLEKRARTLG